MHYLLPLSLLTLASAAPTKTNPTLTTSHAFRLIVNVTTTDLTPPIHLLPLQLAHIGPAQNRAIIRYQSPSSPTPTASAGPIFYQNGTASSPNLTSILTDAGTPPFPEGLAFLPDEGTQGGGGGGKGKGGLFAFGGPGTQGIRLSGSYGELTLPDGRDGGFVACNGTIPYYGPGWSFVLVNWVGETEKVVEGCVPVRLLPECAVLGELPEGAISSHEWAEEVRCYEDVGRVIW